MNLLPSDMLAQLRSAQIDGGLTALVAVRQYLAGTLGAAVMVRVSVVSDVIREDNDGQQQMQVRRIAVKPMQGFTFAAGQVVTYDGHDFIALESSGIDVPTWVCEFKEVLALRAKPGFVQRGR